MARFVVALPQRDDENQLVRVIGAPTFEVHDVLRCTTRSPSVKADLSPQSVRDVVVVGLLTLNPPPPDGANGTAGSSFRFPRSRFGWQILRTETQASPRNLDFPLRRGAETAPRLRFQRPSPTRARGRLEPKWLRLFLSFSLSLFLSFSLSLFLSFSLSLFLLLLPGKTGKHMPPLGPRPIPPRTGSSSVGFPRFQRKD